jgi:hypothetical protein
MEKQVFLGGACGGTTWRREIAIPLLERAGITYFNPQLGIGEWTPACEAAEMKAKAAAEVLLFVVGDETRGVAGISEVAYALGGRRALALAVTDIGPDSRLDGEVPGKAERDDLNRGRIFIRSMAREAAVPVFTEVEGAVLHAIALIQEKGSKLTVERVRAVLEDVAFGKSRFDVESAEGGFLLELVREEMDAATAESQIFRGRKWHISNGASRSDIVRTAFQAVAAWQEHEAREKFLYRGVPVFGPHGDVDDLADLLGAPGKMTE